MPVKYYITISAIITVLMKDWGKIQMWNDAQVYLTDLGFRIDIAVFENFRLPIAPIDRNDIPQKIVDK